MSLGIEYNIPLWVNKLLANHPLVSWLFGHPLWSLGIGLGLLILLSGFFQAIGRGSEKIWIWLLTLPLNIIKSVTKFIWSNSQKIVRYYTARELTVVEKEKLLTLSTSEQIESILNRLKELQTEETQLLSQLATLIKENHQQEN